MATSEFLKGDSRALDDRSALASSVEVLLGVTDAAVQALLAIGVETVYDLATSTAFAHAEDLVAAADASSIAAQLGRLPSDRTDAPVSVDSALIDAQIVSLRMLGPAAATSLTSALNVETVRDLTLWPPYRAAKAILTSSFPSPASPDDAGALVPRLGEFPTERTYYTSIVRRPSSGASGLTDLEKASPLPIGSDAVGFTKPATGAVVTFAQSWYARGITLGNLLHSVALAPGESTRIAVMDWSRATRSESTDQVTESETLASTLTRDRAIGETIKSTAHELQQGSSKAGASSESGSVSGGAGFGLGLFSIGASGSYASSSTNSWSTTASEGTRELGATMNQKIVDSTNQAASSVRDRRASIVKEVSQDEHQSVSTRIVANYNHMHAMTVQYFEVVQVHAVTTSVHRVEAALFIPFALFDFSKDGESLIERFRPALAAAALSTRARALLTTEWGRVSIYPWHPKNLIPFGADRVSVPAAAQLSRFEITQPGGWAPVGVGEVQLVLDDGRVVIASQATSADPYVLSGPVPIHLAKEIKIKSGPVGSGDLVITFTSEGATTTATLRSVPLMADEADGTVATIGDPVSQDELIQHLQAYRRHYSAAILRTLDPTDLAFVLADKTWNGKPVLDLVDPAPIAAIGNQLVFRIPGLQLSGDLTPPEKASASDKDWYDWVGSVGLASSSPLTNIVPLPSGGVFAEAVLGRSNSAEKIDLTRFWNWQDSPIPLQPPEIAAIRMESRATADDTKAPTLGAPVLTPMSPPSIPDSNGLAAALGAMSNGAMFRDMSGMSATADLGKTVAQLAEQAAVAGGSEATKLADIAARKQIEQAKIDAEREKVARQDKADVAKAGAAAAGPPPSATLAGGIINHASGASAAGTAAAMASGAGPAGLVAGVAAASVGGVAAQQVGDAVGKRMLWGPAGEPVGPSSVDESPTKFLALDGTAAAIRTRWDLASALAIASKSAMFLSSYQQFFLPHPEVPGFEIWTIHPNPAGLSSKTVRAVHGIFIDAGLDDEGAATHIIYETMNVAGSSRFETVEADHKAKKFKDAQAYARAVMEAEAYTVENADAATEEAGLEYSAAVRWLVNRPRPEKGAAKKAAITADVREWVWANSTVIDEKGNKVPARDFYAARF